MAEGAGHSTTTAPIFEVGNLLVNTQAGRKS